MEGEEPGVEAAGGGELLVGAGLGDAALFEDQDLVHVPHQPELVGDDEGGPACREIAPALLDRVRGLGVQARLGLGETGVLDVALPAPLATPTPYARWRPWPLLALLTVAALTAGVLEAAACRHGNG